MKKHLMILIGVMFSFVLFGSNGWATTITLIHKNGEKASERDLRILQKIANIEDAANAHLLIIMVDENGKPIKKQRHKRSVIENKISFTFDSPDHPWTSEDLAKIKQWVTDINQCVKSIYGPPAFNNVINVRYNPRLGLAGAYNCQLNEIIISNPQQQDVFVHEIIHAYRDEIMIGNTVYEEGMTRAVEVAVMRSLKVPVYWDSNHSYVYDVKYDMNNVPAMSSFTGSFYRGFQSPLRKYQQAGYAWGKILIEYPDFFRKFNKNYYALAVNDPSLAENVPLLKDIAAKIARKVEGKSFSTWYDQQYIFDMYPTDGVQIMYTESVTEAFLLIYNRWNGSEIAVANAVVTWEVYTCDGTNILNGMGTTNEYGVFQIPFWQQLVDLPYVGMVNLVFNVQSPEGNIRKEQSTLTPSQPMGLYGITSACSGEVSITGPAGSVSLTAVNGFFDYPSSHDVAGTYKLKLGKERRIVTKDASSYFIELQ